MDPQPKLPIYTLTQTCPQPIKHSIHVLTPSESDLVPEAIRQTFKSSGHCVHHMEDGKEALYITAGKVKAHPLRKDCFVVFSEGVEQLGDFYGIASDLLACHKYTRKSTPPTPLKIFLKPPKNSQQILNLTLSKNQCTQLSHGRGDLEGTPEYFQHLAQNFCKQHNLRLKIIKGEDLLKQGFRLMHAVGRASCNQPVFINMGYEGNPGGKDWVAYVGKGVCFDTGGLDIKPAGSMKSMYLDKCGAVSVFTAFQYVVKEKLKINLTVSLGFVENSIGENAYRPGDIITSRKGLTVHIGNTDAQGRLVLADCMHWTQQTYPTKILLQLSTLTGSVSAALGHNRAGLFTNSPSTLLPTLLHTSQKIHQNCWHMPIDPYHHNLIKHKEADITNSSGKVEAGLSQAAAFLECFVDGQTQWAHFDVAGVCGLGGDGFGGRFLLQFARDYCQQ